MNILLSKKDKILIAVSVVIYLVALIIIRNIFAHVFLVLPVFLSIALKFYTNKRLPVVRVIMLDILLLSIIFIRVYQLYKIIKTVNRDPQISKSSQIIVPSIVPEVGLSRLKVILPPVGPYCNGCYSGAPGGLTTSPITNNLLISEGQWVSGEYFTPNEEKKWNYIYYVFKNLLPELPQDTKMIMPGSNFFQDVIKIAVNSSQEFKKSDPDNKGNISTYSYKKLSEKINKEGIKIYIFEVRPTFDKDSLNRRDAIFIKNGATFYMMFDWKTKDFDGTFDKIIDSIHFE